MAQFKNGIFGPASGTIGNLILSSRNGKPYLKSRPDKVSNPKTPKQQASRMKLSMLSGMLSTFKDYIRVGFTERAEGLTARDVAFSANRPRIFIGEFPDIAIDYAQALVSNGSLQPANGPVAALNGLTLTFTWNPDPYTDQPFNNRDMAMVLVYHEQTDAVVYSLRAAERKAGRFEMELPQNMASSPDSLHTWIGFASPDGRRTSQSVYVYV